jgi:hypothetical protein
MTRWRIYYDDGSTYDDAMGEPHQAPVAGFVCAVGYDETGTRYIMHGWDHYCWDKDAAQWWGMDLMGVFDRLRRGLVYAYKEGRTVTKSRFRELMHAADQDPEFPPS